MSIHEHIKIDIEPLYGYLECIEDFSHYIKAISEHIYTKYVIRCRHQNKN